MPRKQRFKPSRKPKPMTAPASMDTAQHADPERSSAPPEDDVRAFDANHPEAPPDGRHPRGADRAEQMEAR